MRSIGHRFDSRPGHRCVAYKTRACYLPIITSVRLSASRINWYCSNGWGVNVHIVWCTSPASVVLQCKLMSGWGLLKTKVKRELGKEFPVLVGELDRSCCRGWPHLISDGGLELTVNINRISPVRVFCSALYIVVLSKQCGQIKCETGKRQVKRGKMRT